MLATLAQLQTNIGLTSCAIWFDVPNVARTLTFKAHRQWIQCLKVFGIYYIFILPYF